MTKTTFHATEQAMATLIPFLDLADLHVADRCKLRQITWFFRQVGRTGTPQQTQRQPSPQRQQRRGVGGPQVVGPPRQWSAVGEPATSTKHIASAYALSQDNKTHFSCIWGHSPKKLMDWLCQSQRAVCGHPCSTSQAALRPRK